MLTKSVNNTEVRSELSSIDAGFKVPDYTDEEREYLLALRTRLEKARQARDTTHEEFDGLTFTEWVQSNEIWANTIMQEKRFQEDGNFQSGTLRSKLMSYLASLLNLDLSPDVGGYNKDNILISSLGEAIETIIDKTSNMDLDDEKKFRRFYELLKQGVVYVEELWDDAFIKDKKLRGSATFDGRARGVTWITKTKRIFSGPTRNIISPLGVYKGDITQYEWDKQPFIFTVEFPNLHEAEAKYGKWERWANVPKKAVVVPTSAPSQALSKTPNATVDFLNWRLFRTVDNRVEVIKYQDKYNNEYAVIINGVLMTPPGLPFPWGYNEYSIVEQILEPFHDKFGYGNSLPRRIRNNIAILDELVRLAVRKTQKSLEPPYLNLSGKVVNRRVFLPGAITSGLSKGDLVPISEYEVQGVSQSELAMIKEIQSNIDKQTVTPLFAGQPSSSAATATEVMETLKQARVSFGLTISAVTWLEWKLAWRRLYNILNKWFDPEGDVVDKAKDILMKRYRRASMDINIDGVGRGKRIVVPIEDESQLPTAQQVYELEESIGKETKIPHRFIFITPQQAKDAQTIWQISLRPKPKRTDELSRVMFDQMAERALLLGADPGFLRERFAQVWDEDPNKMFPAGAQMPSDGVSVPGKGATPSLKSLADRATA